MDLLTRAKILAQLILWRLTWDRRDTRAHHGVPGNPKFATAREAVARIPDGAVLMSSGLGGNARPSVLYWAIRESFEETGHPRDLTVMGIGGIGGRGRVPGTLEELGVEGLCRRFFSGHLETFRAMLDLAERGKLELQCLPQGVMALLLDAQGRGQTALETRTGVGTFMDPRVDRGSPVAPPGGPQFVAVEGDRLRYTMPLVTVAVFNLPAADREGNLYAAGAAMIAESREAARAARHNGGLVIANVGRLLDRAEGPIFLSSDEVDLVVVDPRTEQVGTVPHRRHWPLFTPESDLSVDEGIERLRFINRLLGLTPRRGPVEGALARLAASLLASRGRRRMFVNAGVGLPEEVCRLLHEGGLLEEVTLFTESGVLGGLPAPGVFFGASVCPRELLSSAEVFKRCQERLDATILGALEVDGLGNVNASRRGERTRDMVGPGGLIDLTAAASTVLFVTSWMKGGEIRLEQGALRIVSPGQPKFVPQVREITFCGKEALRANKEVFYCTNVGAFRLSPGGVELSCLMPGIDLRRDVLDACPMPIVLPESGEVPLIETSVITGEGFRLTLPA